VGIRWDWRECEDPLQNIMSGGELRQITVWQESVQQDQIRNKND